MIMLYHSMENDNGAMALPYRNTDNDNVAIYSIAPLSLSTLFIVLTIIWHYKLQ